MLPSVRGTTSALVTHAYFVAQLHGLVHRSVQLHAQVTLVVHVDFASGLPTGFSRVGITLLLVHPPGDGFLTAYAVANPPSRI